MTAYNSTSSASSGWVSVVMPAAAGSGADRRTSPPEPLRDATSSTTGTLSWTASAKATGYAIYYWNGFQGGAARHASASGHDVGVDHGHLPRLNLFLLRRGLQQHEHRRLELGSALIVVHEPTAGKFQ